MHAHAASTGPGKARSGASSGRLALALVLLLLAGLPLQSLRAAAAGEAGGSGAAASGVTFVGSDKCIACHGTEHAEWLSSHHKAAMQEAGPGTVLGDFSGVKFTEGDIESTFFIKDGGYFVRTDGPDGQLADFQIRYTFGLTPLQQYLIELPGGRLQALSIAWDSRPKAVGGQRWYHLYPGRKLKVGDPLHWTGIDQNWNYQCAYCHSTNLQKNYDAAKSTFATRWSEISVGCESCHGPASGHLAWATEPGRAAPEIAALKGFLISLDERRGVSWPMAADGQAQRSTPRTTSKELAVCAPCHARRHQFSADPSAIGSLTDAFRPSTLEAGLYHPDGQQRDEVYTHASFVQSRMHAVGVTCSDCHNPHSGKLHQAGNGVCAQCHAPERFDVPAHHHHAAGSGGDQCVACHMPTQTYMGVDARHDHSMRIPRPDRSVVLGTPNACSACHADRTAAWAQESLKAWYPAPKPGFQDFAEALDLGDRIAPGAQQALAAIARSETSSDIARASALMRLRRLPSREALELAARSLEIESAEVRMAAVGIIADADPATRRTLLVPRLRDASRLVRMDAARALAGEPSRGLAGEDRLAFERAIAEYIDAQKFNAERPESQANLGDLHRDLGDTEQARAALQRAIALDASFVAASISLADLERTVGNEAEAEKVLRRAEAANTRSGPVAHAIGLSLIRQKRIAEAMPLLAMAAQASPEDPRFAYVLAVALHDTGKGDEAIRTLGNALARHPYDRDLLLTLANYEIERKGYAAALEKGLLLQRLEPADPQVAQLVAALRQMTR